MAAFERGMFMIAVEEGGGGGPGLGFWLMIPIILGSLASGYFYSLDPTHPWFPLSSILVSFLILTIIFVKELGKAQL